MDQSFKGFLSAWYLLHMATHFILDEELPSLLKKVSRYLNGISSKYLGLNLSASLGKFTLWLGSFTTSSVTFLRVMKQLSTSLPTWRGWKGTCKLDFPQDICFHALEKAYCDRSCGVYYLSIGCLESFYMLWSTYMTQVRLLPISSTQAQRRWAGLGGRPGHSGIGPLQDILQHLCKVIYKAVKKILSYSCFQKCTA